MQIIAHRINTIKQLKNIDFSNGIEVDIRYHNNDLILHHDPFQHHQNSPEKFEDLLIEFTKNHSGYMILNTKSEGLELLCIELMKKYNYKNWFFLDLSMPSFVTYSNKAIARDIEGFTPDNLAVRYSEFEPIEYALSFKDKVKWVWVDCFTKLTLDKQSFKTLKNANFNICLVAPELQKHDIKQTTEYQSLLDSNNIILDAVCTKRPDLWTK